MTEREKKFFNRVRKIHGIFERAEKIAGVKFDGDDALRALIEEFQRDWGRKETLEKLSEYETFFSLPDDEFFLLDFFTFPVEKLL